MPIARPLALILIGWMFTAAASAQAPTAVLGSYDSVDACLKHASALGQAAEERKLSEDRLEDIDDLLLRMETFCDARRFTEAAATAEEIAAELDRQ